MELAIQIIAWAILALIAFAIIFYVVDAIWYANSHFPSDGKSEFHARDRYEVAERMRNDEQIFMN